MTRVIFCHSLGPPTSDDPAEERSMLLALLGQNIKGGDSLELHKPRQPFNQNWSNRSAVQ